MTLTIFFFLSQCLTYDLGPDPADPERILIKKIIKVNPTTFCFEETRITPSTTGDPTVHSTVMRLGNFNIEEKLDPEEIQIRGAHRPFPNIIGFSLFFKDASFGSHMSIVENSMTKLDGYRW